MVKFETLDHPADLKIRAFGKTKEEVFLNMLLGMINGLRPKLKTLGEGEAATINIKSTNLETLLVDFLSKVLYLIQVNHEVYNNVKFKKFTDTELEAELSGKEVERFGEDIKAVTYNNLEVKQKEDGWEAIVLFDV